MANGNKVDSKIAFLKLLEILKETDKEHPMTNKALKEALLAAGIDITKETVSLYLEKFREFYGEETICCESSVRNEDNPDKLNIYTYKHYYQRDITNEELAIIIETLIFSKILPEREIIELANKVRKMASKEFQKTLNFINAANCIPSKQYTINPSTQENMVLIRDVIFKNRDLSFSKKSQIRFHFNGYDTKGKLKQVYPRDGDEWYYLLPLQICETDHQQILVAYKDGTSQLSHYRIDLMSEIQMVEPNKNILEKEQIEKLISINRKDISDYMTEHLFMYYGEAKRIEIEIRKFEEKRKKNASMAILHDAFGSNWRTISETDEMVIASVKCVPDAMQAWIMKNMDIIVRIVGPREVKEQIDNKIEESLKKYIQNKR